MQQCLTFKLVLSGTSEKENFFIIETKLSRYFKRRAEEELGFEYLVIKKHA